MPTVLLDNIESIVIVSATYFPPDTITGSVLYTPFSKESLSICATITTSSGAGVPSTVTVPVYWSGNDGTASAISIKRENRRTAIASAKVFLNIELVFVIFRVRKKSPPPQSNRRREALLVT